MNAKSVKTVVAVVGDPGVSRLSDATRRLLEGMSPNNTIEVVIIHPTRTPPTGRTVKPTEPVTIAARIRELIEMDLTDDQIWPTIKKEFKLTDDRRRGYIGGQRRLLARRNEEIL